jgi:ssDNA-binding Zn-finger/Zn-ribbon topoisomerase 1
MTKQDLLNNLNDNQKDFDFSLVPETFAYGDELFIICHKKDSLGREHGTFKTTYGKFIKRGDGCPKCNGKYMDKELFVAESRLIHGDLHSYDEFEFVDKSTKGKIYCNKHHIFFEQSPRKHLMGHGCPICRYEKSAHSKTHTQEWFRNKVKEVWGDRYDISNSVYINGGTNVKVVCHKKDRNGVEHGEFEITPENFLHKTKPQGCPKCGREKVVEALRDTKEDFVYKANIVHKGRYRYHKVDYVNSQTPVWITCLKHGDFLQAPNNHLQGQGCPYCKQSVMEAAMRKFLFDNDIKFTQEKTFDWLVYKRNMKLDFYLDDYGVAIECQGRQHFEETGIGSLEENQKRDKLKLKLCIEHKIPIFYFSNINDVYFPYKVYKNKKEMLNSIKCFVESK